MFPPWSEPSYGVSRVAQEWLLDVMDYSPPARIWRAMAPPSSGKSWEKGHLLFLGEPDESREMEPFPVVSLGSEGMGNPSIKTSIEQDLYLSAGQRERHWRQICSRAVSGERFVSFRRGVQVFWAV